MGSAFLSVGGALNSLNTVRNLVFSQKHKKWASHAYIPILFCALTVVVSLIRLNAWYGIFPMLGSILAVIGFWCSDTRHIRLFNLPAALLWLVYAVMTSSISSILCNIFSVVSILIAWARSAREGRGKTKQSVG